MKRFLVAGVDEAGCGPLAGGVYAAAVILHPRRKIAGLADSKILTAKKREELALEIRKKAIAWAIASSSVGEIDDLNILQARLLAMRRAIERLQPQPEAIEVDGKFCPKVTMPATAIVNGDATVPSISAASILAKTARDADMLRLHALYPDYGFDQHKGYATAAHREALSRFGFSPIHRLSFAPVSRLLEHQLELLDDASVAAR